MALMACAAEPGLHERAQPLAAEGEPTLALGPKDMRTSLNRRKAPLPSMAWVSFPRSSGSSTIGMKRSIHRYCSRELTGSMRR
jgi:hypothetical protein